jgi:polysaccharide pyruvyl transferase WcaK-like protein
MNSSSDSRDRSLLAPVALPEKDPTTARLGVRTWTKRRRKKPKLSFFGHFGKGNFGNESTLQAILYHLRRLVPDAELTCICTGPSATATTHNIAAIPISRVGSDDWRPHSRIANLLFSTFVDFPNEVYRWFEAFVRLKGTDVLIIPGTGLLTDAYGLSNWGPYNIFKWSLIAKLRGCKVLFVSVGAGPLYSSLGKFFVTSALRWADFRSYRDASSMHYLEGVGFSSASDPIYPDLVFSLPEGIIPPDIRGTRCRPVAGIGLMEYAGRYSVENPEYATYRNYLEALVALVGWLLGRGYDVRLLIGDLCDKPIMQEFRRLLEERISHNDTSRIMETPVDSVEQLLTQIAGTDLVVATRFHNVLLALLCNKPAIAISFHHKCSSLMTTMGLSEYCVDINDLKAEELISKVGAVEKRSVEIKSLVRRRAAQCREALEKQYQLIVTEV